MASRVRGEARDQATMEAAIRGLVERDRVVAAQDRRMSELTREVARTVATRLEGRCGLEVLVAERGLDASRRSHGMLLDHARGRQVPVTGRVAGGDVVIAVDGRDVATVSLVEDGASSEGGVQDVGRVVQAAYERLVEVVFVNLRAPLLDAGLLDRGRGRAEGP